ncbi:MAG: Rossmann-like domain-containing protein [Syntrophaceae bacterium]
MLETGEIAGRLHRHLAEPSRRFAVEDVRIGASYVAVVLTGGRIGVAARLKEAVGAEIEPRASERLSGRPAETLLDRLVCGAGAVERALGLAAANALIHPDVPDREEDTLGLMKLRPGERVAMVGLFRPIVPRIEATGVRLSVIERDTPHKERRQALGACDVAIVTATTLLNGTLEEVLNELGRPRHVALLGPSTPLCEKIFRATPVTHLGGSAIVDGAALLQVISRGGGTPDMRPCLRFVNIRVHRS